jgi:3-oxoadipate enol-lactonase
MNQRELIRPDATIRYWTGGQDTAPTLVLLHGATLDHQAWDPQVDALRPRSLPMPPATPLHATRCRHR